MLFPTLVFGVFFIIVFTLAWSLEHENGPRKLALLVASFVFYGWWDWRFCFLLAASSVLNWAIGRAIGSAGPAQRGLLTAVGVAVNLLILGFFKYYGFFLESLADVLRMLDIERDLIFLQIILPVGISFYTFQGISYVVDVKRDEVQARQSLTDVMLYISFFPQLVAGPIVRAKDFLPQLDETPRLSREAAALGLLLIVWGLFKKAVIANELSTGLVDDVFFDPSFYSPVDLLFATYGYAVQIYCDFSAYSDIAIGCAALLGYRFGRNFDQPYRARSFQDFWRRWHISLSTWLRDYLYIPLGGSRGGGFATNRNLFLTMLLGGIWHGAAWTFIAWGALHGAALVIERMAGLAKSGRGLISLFITFHVVCLGWILFRAADFGLAWSFLTGFFGDWTQGPEAVTPFLAVLVVLGLGMHALPSRGIEFGATALSKLRSPFAAVIIAGLFLIVEALRPSGVAPFIYFQF
jgi:D-alanyl-lipoteichoic acid acyltransferase DltB (MBOAT superfamily)